MREGYSIKGKHLNETIYCCINFKLSVISVSTAGVTTGRSCGLSGLSGRKGLSGRQLSCSQTVLQSVQLGTRIVTVRRRRRISARYSRPAVIPSVMGRRERSRLGNLFRIINKPTMK
jgi:hypothetical protein